MLITPDADNDSANGLQYRNQIPSPPAAQLNADQSSTCVQSVAGLTQATTGRNLATVTPITSGKTTVVGLSAILDSFASLEPNSTLRWRILGSNAELLADRTLTQPEIQVSASAGTQGPCGSPIGLIDGAIATGQFKFADGATGCGKAGSRTSHVNIEVAKSLACGEYTVELSFTSAKKISIRKSTFSIACIKSIGIDFSELKLPTFGIGETLIQGDNKELSTPWSIRNSGNSPILVQPHFADLKETQSDASIGDIFGAMRKNENKDSTPPTEPQTAPVADAITSSTTPTIPPGSVVLCANETAILDVTVQLPLDAPTGEYSSNLRFDMSGDQSLTEQCPTVKEGPPAAPQVTFLPLPSVSPTPTTTVDPTHSTSTTTTLVGSSSLPTPSPSSTSVAAPDATTTKPGPSQSTTSTTEVSPTTASQTTTASTTTGSTTASSAPPPTNSAPLVPSTSEGPTNPPLTSIATTVPSVVFDTPKSISS
jgi:hypothetical protein